jgi:hypothetical protein
VWRLFVCSGLTAEQKDQLNSVEKQIVSLTSWLKLAYPGPPETTNCGSANFHDWHLEIFENPSDHPPQVQATGHKAQKIRVTGYLMWDDDHNGSADVGSIIQYFGTNGFHHPWRSMALEVHPVMKIAGIDLAGAGSLLAIGCFIILSLPCGGQKAQNPAHETKYPLFSPFCLAHLLCSAGSRSRGSPAGRRLSELHDGGRTKRPFQQKVSAQLEVIKPAPQTVENNR